MMKNVMRILFITILISLSRIVAMAGPGDEEFELGGPSLTEDNGDPDPDPDAIPLDPGTWVLAAVVVGYGLKKWRDNRIHQKTESL